MRIAYVSDSLGRRLPMRGIFNYSITLVKLLSEQGHEIDLVLQKPPCIKKVSKALSDKHSFTSVIKTAIIIDSLVNKPMRVKFQRIRSIMKTLLNLNFFYKLYDFIPFYFEKPYVVKNEMDQLDYVPDSHQFFSHFKHYLLFNGMYSDVDRLLVDRKIDLSDYDLILIDTPHHIKIKKNANASIVNVIHDLLPYTDPCISRLARKFFDDKMKRTLAIADKFIFVSKTIKQTFEKHLGADRPSGVIYPIFKPSITLDDLSKFALLSESSEIQPKPIKIVTVVSFDERKNLQNLIYAHHLLPCHYYLEIIGNVEARYYLISKTQENRVKFYGYTSDTEKVNLLYQADALCFPSLAEGFGIPIIEGLYYTGRVVCSDIPVFREIADGYVALCDPHSPWDIADKITHTCSLPKLDKVTREQSVARFRSESQAKALEQIIS